MHCLLNLMLSCHAQMQRDGSWTFAALALVCALLCPHVESLSSLRMLQCSTQFFSNVGAGRTVNFTVPGALPASQVNANQIKIGRAHV